MKHGSFQLSQNFPNPFNPVTTICFSIIIESHVELKIYDVLGQEIKTILNEKLPAGKYLINLELSHLNSGVYFYKLKSGNFTQSRKMILIKRNNQCWCKNFFASKRCLLVCDMTR